MGKKGQSHDKRDTIMRAGHRQRVLVKLDRGPSSVTDLQDDLAARCGSREAVRIALDGCRLRGLVESTGRGSAWTATITDEGRAELARIRGEGAAGCPTCAADRAGKAPPR